MAELAGTGEPAEVLKHALAVPLGRGLPSDLNGSGGVAPEVRPTGTIEPRLLAANRVGVEREPAALALAEPREDALWIPLLGRRTLPRPQSCPRTRIPPPTARPHRRILHCPSAATSSS